METKRKILIVDDSAEIEDVIRWNLESKEYDVVSAETTEEAASLFHGPDEIGVVITDLQLPGTAGYDFVDTLRNTLKSSVPVLVITAYPSKESVLRAGEFGVREYLVKPFDFHRLLKSVDECMGELESKKKDSAGDFPAFDGIRALVTSNNEKEFAELFRSLNRLKVETFGAKDWLGVMKLMQEEQPHVAFISTSLRDVDGAALARGMAMRNRNSKMMLVLVNDGGHSLENVPPEVDFVVRSDEICIARVVEMLNQYTML